MVVNSTIFNLFHPVKKNQHTHHCTKHTGAFMIYLFEWLALMNVTFAESSLKKHSKVNSKRETRGLL